MDDLEPLKNCFNQANAAACGPLTDEQMHQLGRRIQMDLTEDGFEFSLEPLRPEASAPGESEPESPTPQPDPVSRPPAGPGLGR